MPESFDYPVIERAVAPHLPAPASLDIRPIATGKFNTSFYVSAPGIDWVLRIAPPRDAVFVFYEKDMMRQEPAIHRLLLDKTQVPVALIVAYDDSHQAIDRDFILMERLPGRPIAEAHCERDKVLEQVGVALAQTHAQTATIYGYIGAHCPLPPQRYWIDAFYAMWNRLIDDIVAVGHYDEAESTAMRGLLDQHIRLFDRPVPATLLHMDVWDENILVDETSTLTGLIDWDRALWGDPEIEFAVLDYCGISQPAFWEGYGQQRDASPEAQIRQLFYLLYEVQKYIVIRQGRGGDAAGARRYKQQVLALLQRAGL